MAIRRTPISIFVSAKDKKIYVRQDFVPLFSAPITIDASGSAFWNARLHGDGLFGRPFELPLERRLASRRAAQNVAEDIAAAVVEARYVRGKRVEENVAPPPAPSPLTPQEVLARIEIPQDIIERISQLIIPGSSLIVSDHGLGEETGVGTDFIVVAR